MNKRFSHIWLDNRGPFIMFILLALIQAVFYLFSVGPLTIPDPDLHANTSYALATGQILNLPESDHDRYGNKVKNQSISGDSRYLMTQGRNNDFVYKIIGNAFTHDNHKNDQKRNDRSSGEYVTIPNIKVKSNRSNQYFPVLYVPQAIGLWLAIHLNTSPYHAWQAARISNFTFFLVMFCLSIALTPRDKYFFVIIGTLPATIFLASSLMSDSFFLAVSACFLSLVLFLAQNGKPVGKKAFIGLVTLTALLFFSKIVYVAMAILVLALPNAILNWKRKTAYVGIAAACTLPVYTLWSHLYGTTWAIACVDSNAQALLHNPIKATIMIVWNIFFLFQKGLGIPGALTMEMTLLLILALLVLLAGKQLRSPHGMTWHQAISTNRYAILAFISALLAIGATYGYELLIWNQLPYMVLTSEIQGFQGRYLLPLLPLLACLPLQVQREEIMPLARLKETGTVSTPAHD
ncbi:hypothetical protein CRD60_06830 [Bifidobacterium aemilianum]|uniref:DUF2142 domain-containing protein n=1 Tax=Bifidobacterium aemilianum TaxID=2493120 RepID=A0A366K8L8_9BIFI|nr:DUF2142 domain-containing protein [Bifidobacterium aemilianum]RBP97473.1 hypothetical protein CRD60_06830 [Bifidobacterium aemilianum]